MRNWKKIPSTFKACARQLEYMASIVDTLSPEEREQFHWYAQEVFLALEGTCCDRDGQLTDRGMKKVDAVFPWYQKCIPK